LVAAGLLLTTPVGLPVKLPCCGARAGDPPELPLKVGAGLDDGLELGVVADVAGAGTEET
jgi:hypothetical protein